MKQNTPHIPLRAILLSLLTIVEFIHSNNQQPVLQFYCTACDDCFYGRLLNLIGSIHRFNFDQVVEIAVFDLGLTTNETRELEGIDRVKIYRVEQVNPEILKPLQVAGRRVVGHFSWKPVVIKQAAEKFPYFFYLDAGTTVLANLNIIFEYIIENGYFLVDSGGRAVSDHIPLYVLKNLVRSKYPTYETQLLQKSTYEISAGIQGIGRSVLDNYVYPVYELASDIHFFEDDGSSPRGYGFGRHDQVLFSIMAHILGFKINTMGHPFELHVGNIVKTIHIDAGAAKLTPNAILLAQGGGGPQNIAAIRWLIPNPRCASDLNERSSF